MIPIKTVSELLQTIQKGYSNPKALNYVLNGQWSSLSSENFLDQIKYVALALESYGIKKGDRVGIIAPPSPFWTIVDLAIIASGAISVTIFANIAEENFLYEINQTELKVIFFAEEIGWELCAKYQDLFHLIIDLENSSYHQGMKYSEFIEKGKEVDQGFPHKFEELLQNIDENDTATIIYTSGSTGTPKGVEISHRNLFCCVHINPFNWDPKKERYFNILPLAHVFGRSLNFFMIVWGISVYYYNDVKNIAGACQEVQPTILVVVPRLLEKVYNKILSNIQKLPFIKRKLAKWAIGLAKQEKKGFAYPFFHCIADQLVYKKLRDKTFGGKVSVVISGGAFLNPHLCQTFHEIGIPIYEGWGMTEAATITVNRYGHLKIGSVGKVLSPEVKIKLSSEKELLVHGPLVMKRYYKNPKATEIAIDEEGWLHTGDRGEIDSEGYVKILGRLKELYKTSTGEYVVPTPIEQSLCKDPLIDMALVIAEGQKFTSCLLFPDLDFLHDLKKKNKVNHLSDEDFLNHDFIRKRIDSLIKTINIHLNHWEQIQRYRFILKPLTIEEGDLTPSMKIKRDSVANKYRDVIDSIYQEELYG